MEHAGMVHALQQVHRLLRPAGTLIEIRPRREPALLEIHRNGAILLAEPTPDQDDDWEDYRQAGLALAKAAERGLFTLEDARDFDFVAYADSVAELQAALEAANAYSTSTPEPEATARLLAFGARVDAIARAAGTGVELAYREPARISRLRRSLT